MDYTKLYKILENEPAFRKKQVENAVFRLTINDWDEATTLPKALKEKLKNECPFIDILDKLIESDDGTIKARLKFGNDLIETVLMRHPKRNTVCISSQVGCPLGCSFCFTGQNGYKRNLESSEIIEQILFFQRYLKQFKEEITNVVFMGMGEPFLNYENVVTAINIINDKEKLNIGARKISVSTIGIVPEIIRFAKDFSQCNLAFSLHASNERLRNELIPANKKYPLGRIFSAIRTYQKETNRRVMIEYVMLKDVNDSDKNAEELAKLLKDNLGTLFVVNLIQYNDTGKYISSSKEKINKFKNILLRNGINAVERYRFGESINAACGQLAHNA